MAATAATERFLKVDTSNSRVYFSSSLPHSFLFVSPTDTAFEWAQFALILYTFAFLLGTFHLLLVGTETLSDYLHEGNSLFEWKKCEPVWMSKYEPPIQF